MSQTCLQDLIYIKRSVSIHAQYIYIAYMNDACMLYIMLIYICFLRYLHRCYIIFSCGSVGIPITSDSLKISFASCKRKSLSYTGELIKTVSSFTPAPAKSWETQFIPQLFPTPTGRGEKRAGMEGERVRGRRPESPWLLKIPRNKCWSCT